MEGSSKLYDGEMRTDQTRFISETNVAHNKCMQQRALNWASWKFVKGFFTRDVINVVVRVARLSHDIFFFGVMKIPPRFYWVHIYLTVV